MTKTAALTDPKIPDLRATRKAEQIKARKAYDALVKAGEGDTPKAKGLLKRASANLDKFRYTDSRGLLLDCDFTKADVTKRFTWRAEVPTANGKESLSTIGYWPEIDCKTARELAVKERAAIEAQKASGVALVTPSVARRRQDEAKAKKAAEEAENVRRAAEGEYLVGTFGAVAKIVFEHDIRTWKGGAKGMTGTKFTSTMKRFVQGYFDHKHFTQVTVADINAMKERVMKADTKNRTKGGKTALHQVLRFVGSVCDKAIDMGLIEMSPVVIPRRKNDRKALKQDKRENHPGVKSEEALGRLIASVLKTKRPSHVDAMVAFMCVVFTWQRRDTIINMEWTELNRDVTEWRIPKAKMKKCGDVEVEHDHIVPIPTHMRDLLALRWAQREDPRNKRKSPFVFPSHRAANDYPHFDKDGDKVPAHGMSRDMIQDMLNAAGWKDIHTTHGTRTTGRSLIRNEVFGDHFVMKIKGKEMIMNTHFVSEIQLAHVNGEEMKKLTANMTTTYFDCDGLVERRFMMQAWADYVMKVWKDAAPEDSGFMRSLGKEKAALGGPQVLALAH